MKIEPVAYVRKDAIDFLQHASKSAICRTDFYKTSTDEAGHSLYTEAQLRQLGEACADVVYDHEEGVACEAAIRELIKEMLG